MKQLPLNGTQYDKWLQSVDEKVAKSIDAKLAYLERDYGYDSTLGLLEKDAVVGPYSRSVDQVDEVSQALRYYNNEENLLRSVEIPQGYSRMSAVHTIELVEQQGNHLVLEVNAWIGETMSTYRFEALLNQFAERDVERSLHHSVEPLILSNGNAALVVDDYSLTLSGTSVSYANISGILFVK